MTLYGRWYVEFQVLFWSLSLALLRTYSAKAVLCCLSGIEKWSECLELGYDALFKSLIATGSREVKLEDDSPLRGRNQNLVEKDI